MTWEVFSGRRHSYALHTLHISG
ncbi:hypothetical protein D030_2317A, partial [Vibrio parahaemolyticus AQ3810]